MKLKKIASLALAGIMAVSMLAGCSGKGNADSTVVVPSNNSIAAAVNDGQSAANKVKVTFTADSDLEDALEQAIAIKGNDTADTIQSQLENLVVFEGDKKTDTSNLWTGATTAEGKGATTGLDGKKQTYIDVVKPEASTEKAALKMAAKAVDEVVARLAAKTANVASGSKYYAFDNTGKVAMVTVENVDGTTSYYVAFTITQTATEKEAA